MLLSQFIREGSGALAALYPEAEAHSLVLMLCEALLGTRSYTHIVEPAFTVDPLREGPLREALSRLEAGEPVQYVLGKALFCGREFRVTPDVLIPRGETEILALKAVEWAREMAPPLRVLDLCTGSGNIAWTVALEVPSARVVGVDLSAAALEVARSQAFPLPAGAAAPRFVQADVLDGVVVDGPFDLILSNPPYVMEREKALMRPNVLRHEPAGALFVPDHDPLLFYRSIARWAQKLLVPGGRGIVEINEQLGPETCQVFRTEGFREVSLLKDYFDKDRFVLFR
jgi:release factor glutamine methyltransferase